MGQVTHLAIPTLMVLMMTLSHSRVFDRSMQQLQT